MSETKHTAAEEMKAVLNTVRAKQRTDKNSDSDIDKKAKALFDRINQPIINFLVALCEADVIYSGDKNRDIIHNPESLSTYNISVKNCPRLEKKGHYACYLQLFCVNPVGFDMDINMDRIRFVPEFKKSFSVLLGDTEEYPKIMAHMLDWLLEIDPSLTDKAEALIKDETLMDVSDAQAAMKELVDLKPALKAEKQRKRKAQKKRFLFFG